MNSVIVRLSPDEARELTEALLTAQNCMAETRMLAIDRAGHAQIGSHRRCLCRFVWQLSHPDPWAEEEEWTLVQRCKVLLLIFAARLFGDERRHVARMARALGRVHGREEHGRWVQGRWVPDRE